MSFRKAVTWLKKSRIPGSGFPPCAGQRVATAEVTGYLIPTLLAAGEEELAIELALWEASVQRPEGSFTAPDGVPYTFDTAQVVRGLLAALDRLPSLEANLRCACDYLVSQISSSGRVETPDLQMWRLADGRTFSEYANLYVLPPLLAAGHRLGESRYINAVKRSLSYYTRRPDLVDFKPELTSLSHIFGYMMEALVELDERELALRGLRQAEDIQEDSGAIPAYPGATWVCSTGMAQLAVAWLKLGVQKPAGRAIHYLKKIQNPSGGFYGGYGREAAYFPTQEITWAVKFFLDAVILEASGSTVNPLERGRLL